MARHDRSTKRRMSPSERRRLEARRYAEEGTKRAEAVTTDARLEALFAVPSLDPRNEHSEAHDASLKKGATTE